MIAAIREMAEKKIELRSISTLTAEYLHACSLLFETGILSHEMITSVSSKPLINMAEGLKWFKKWKDELVDEPGMYIFSRQYIMYTRKNLEFFTI